MEHFDEFKVFIVIILKAINFHINYKEVINWLLVVWYNIHSLDIYELCKQTKLI